MSEVFEDDFETISDDADDSEIIALTELGSTLIQAILEKEPISNVQDLIDAGAPLWYQDEEGTSALHAAAYVENEQLVKLLIEEGVVWNAVDNLQNTAGDIALSLNNVACYNLIRDAGIRSEMLLTLLSSQTSLNPTPSSLVLQDVDNSAVASTDEFLSSQLRYTRDAHGQDICLLELDNGQEVGVMMGWEREIMQKTVENLCTEHAKRHQGLKILNVGFGLGIIDDFFQKLNPPPALHVIVEPHRDVLAHMKGQGWYDKKGVSILEGKWQDCIASEALQGFGKFDVIYTDTFSENYSELHNFFSQVRELLAGPESRFSFFNGLGATNALFYDVYTRLSELHLSDAGLDVMWSDVDRVQSKDLHDFSHRPALSRGKYMYLIPPLLLLLLLLPHESRMTIHSLYIYDRHCACVYYQDWHRTKQPRRAREGGILNAVSQAVYPLVPDSAATLSAFSSPRNTLSSKTGLVVAVGEDTPVTSSQNPPEHARSNTLPFDEEAKLVYGVVLSLRNMVKKLSGRDEQFTSYRTSTYRLHLYETMSGYKFVILSDAATEGLRFILRQIYSGPFLDFVVRNPLISMDSRTHGIDNDYFRASIDRFVRGLSVFN